ncbi:MAG: hypothetical protein ACREUL_19385 [Steroidobacteraceae bacterium]
MFDRNQGRFIDNALRDMIVAGVRALLVMRGEGGAYVRGMFSRAEIERQTAIEHLGA